MTTKLFAPIAMVLALVLGALPASAEHDKRNKRDAKLEKIAHKLEKATYDLYCDAVESRHHRHSRAERRALRSLERLSDRAKRFHAQVENRGVYDYATQREFQRLQRAYVDAQWRLSHLHARKAVHRDFDRVEKLMGKLDTKIARADYRRDEYRHDGRRRDGRDRYGWRSGNSGWSFAWNY